MGMTVNARKLIVMVALAGFWTLLAYNPAFAGDLKINIPKRSRLTPVQKLNREGVEAIKKHKYEKARVLFYKAYLFDPGDPFTLNNLGYVAELEGQVERAHNFYSMATSQATEALIDRASNSRLEGESLQAAISQIRDVPMQINRSNVEAVRLLSQGRIREADKILHQALSLDPQNAFTLNNLGVAREAQGEYGEALKYYNAAANAHVQEPVIVTMNEASRGKPISEMARDSASRLRNRMKSLQSDEAQVALLNLRGVSALNRNDWRTAWDYFRQAYTRDPQNAFSLNNAGYIAEMNGDLETAQDFYTHARNAGNASSRVGLATRPAAEGMRLFAVAGESEGQVSSTIEANSEAKRRRGGPIQLKRRDGTPAVPAPETPENTPPQSTPPQNTLPQSTPPPSTPQ